MAYFIIGFPGETRRQIRNTVAFSRRLQLDWCTIFIYNPLPGSELYDDCLKRGYITEDSFFEAGNQYFSSLVSSEEWTSVELEKIIRQEYLRNYVTGFRNPRVVLPRHLAFFRHRPNFPFYLLAPFGRTLRLMWQDRFSPAKTDTTSP